MLVVLVIILWFPLFFLHLLEHFVKNTLLRKLVSNDFMIIKLFMHRHKYSHINAVEERENSTINYLKNTHKIMKYVNQVGETDEVSQWKKLILYGCTLDAYSYNSDLIIIQGLLVYRAKVERYVKTRSDIKVKTHILPFVEGHTLLVLDWSTLKNYWILVIMMIITEIREKCTFKTWDTLSRNKTLMCESGNDNHQEQKSVQTQ